MELKLKDIKPNPFKNKINEGKLNEEQIEKIQSNLKELGLMGSLPVFKKDNNYYLISGHHRVEALKRQFGEDYSIKVELHDYTTEQVLRGMVVENLSQRIDDFREEMDNIVLIKDYLEKNQFRLLNNRNQTKENPKGAGRYEEAGSRYSIYKWLNQQGKEVMSESRISQLLRIHDELNPEVLDLVQKHKAGSKAEGITAAEAIALISGVPKEEQKEVATALINSEETNKIDRIKALTEYKQADEETKEKVRKGEIKIEDVGKIKGETLGNEYNHRAIKLVVEMQTLRKALYQLRKERLFDTFSDHEKKVYKTRLLSIKTEYTALMKEVEDNLGVLE